MKTKKKTSKKKTGRLYSKGQLNFLIDDAIHPLTNKSAGFVLVDEILHMWVEMDPKASLEKFVRYNLPKLIKKVAEDL